MLLNDLFPRTLEIAQAIGYLGVGVGQGNQPLVAGVQASCRQVLAIVVVQITLRAPAQQHEAVTPVAEFQAGAAALDIQLLPRRLGFTV